MSSLHQLQLAYHPEQDRLLLRATTRDGREFRFWLTRRLLKGLWPALHRALAREVGVQTPADPMAQREVLQFRRQQAVQRADFSTPFEELHGRTHPLGEEPVLVARAALAPARDGRHGLSLLPRAGPGCNLALTDDLLHSLIRLLEDALERADWGLATPILGSASTEPPPSPGRLN